MVTMPGASRPRTPGHLAPPRHRPRARRPRRRRSPCAAPRGRTRPVRSCRMRPHRARGRARRRPRARRPGGPRRTTSPCSETVAGAARRIHCAGARAPPACELDLLADGDLDGPPQPDRRWRSRCWTRGRPRACARARRPGRRARARRRCRRPRAAQARAPAAPPLPPEVETSTSVLARSRPTRRRRLARAGRAVAAGAEDARELDQRRRAREVGQSRRVRTASRCASTTMRRAERPGRTPITVIRSRRPSTVCARPRRSARRGSRSCGTPRLDPPATPSVPVGARATGRERVAELAQRVAHRRPPGPERARVVEGLRRRSARSPARGGSRARRRRRRARSSAGRNAAR